MIKNIIANYIGRFWGIFSNIVFIPLYIHFLGIEGYSIISFSLVLVGLMMVLDVGMTTTLSKEFATRNNSLDTKQKLFISLETIYIFIAFFIIIFIFIFSRPIAYHWLNVENASPEKVSHYLNILGIGISFQLLSQFYWGGLIGLEQQVKANMYQVGLGIVRNGLVVLALLFYPNLYVFFIWQSTSMIIYAIILRQSIVKSIFGSFSLKNIFKIYKPTIKSIWRFAGGVMLISLVAAINSQMDKLAISKFLPITTLGYYTLAVSLSQGLLMIISPLGTAIFPRFTALYSENKQQEASYLFQKAFLFSNIIVFSFASNMIFNAESLIWVWTGNKQYALESASFVPYLALGMVVGSLQTIPYYISLANGFTKFNNYFGIISLLITFPGYWIMTKYYGAVGAAMVWCGIQLITTPIYLYLINMKFIKLISPVKIFVKYILLPAGLTALIALTFSKIDYFHPTRWITLFWIGVATFVTLLISIVSFINKVEIMSFVNIKIKSAHN